MGLNISIVNAGSVRRQYTPDVIAREDAKSATGLVAWYDFGDNDTVFSDAGSTKADNTDGIYQVTNKAYDGLGASSTSLNAFIVQTSSSSRPTYYTAGYADFDGGDSLLSSILLGQVSTGRMGGVALTQQNFTISIVLDNDIPTPGSQKFYLGFGDAGRKASSLGISTTNKLEWTGEADRTANIRSSAAYSGVQEYWTIVGGTANTSGSNERTLAFYKNGVLDSTDTTDLSTYNRVLTANDADVGFQLGAWSGSTDRFDGKIYEYIQYNKALSSLQLAQLNGYYGQKYNL